MISTLPLPFIVGHRVCIQGITLRPATLCPPLNVLTGGLCRLVRVYRAYQISAALSVPLG